MPEPLTISAAPPNDTLQSGSPPESIALLAALPVAVLALDARFMIRYVNPAAEEWLGVSARHCVGQPIEALLAVDERLAQLLERSVETGSPLSDYDCEIATRRSTHPSLATLHISPLPETRGVLLTIDPRPHAPLLKEQVARADIMRSSGLMAAMLAHEVKNPLSGIRGAAQLLATDARDDQQNLLTLIGDEVDRIRGVLAMVEPFSDTAATRAEPVNVHQALEYARRVTSAGVAANLTFVEDYDISLPPAFTSRDALVQVLVNIITNAAEAMEGQNDARIRLITTALQDFRFGPENQRSLHIIIEDNGPGVPAEMQAQLFEPFVSSKRAGRGLGLAIAAKLMSDMGGHVILEASRPGSTRFRLSMKSAA